MYAKRSGVLHWELSDKNAGTTEVERVAVDAAKKNGTWRYSVVGPFGAEGALQSGGASH